jgi:excinuclease UvrABC nuclease subunit
MPAFEQVLAQNAQEQQAAISEIPTAEVSVNTATEAEVGQEQDTNNSNADEREGRPPRLKRQRQRRGRDVLLSLTDRATGRARHKLSKDLIKDLPEKPGVYLMQDAVGKIIYVGKAKNLRSRVSSYYSEPLGYTRKIDGLTENIAKIEHIVTGSELEALLLESKLIKYYLPKYNQQLRNYETYPFIKIDLTQRFPRIYSVREIKDDGGRYFGPFKNHRAVETTIEIIEQIFPVRNCTRSFELELLERQKQVRPPCLRYDLGRCPGPCLKGKAGDSENAAYLQIINDVTSFLSGEKTAMLDMLWERMNKAAHKQDYEKARLLRDAIQQVEKIVANQSFLAAAIEGNNLLIYLPSAQKGAIELLFVCGGRLGRQVRVETSLSPTELAAQLDQIWQELQAREAALNLQQPQSGKRGGRVIRQEEVDEINIISRWVYSNSDNSAIIRVGSTLTASFWSQSAVQILSATLTLDTVDQDVVAQGQFATDIELQRIKAALNVPTE